MKFDYENVGDILYGIESFRFRLATQETAEITLMNLLDDEQYVYDIELPQHMSIEFQKINSADYPIFASLGMECKGIFDNKQEALQHAIKTINNVVAKINK